MVSKRLATALLNGPAIAVAGYAAMTPTLPHVLMTAGAAVMAGAATFVSLSSDTAVAVVPAVDDTQAVLALLPILALLSLLAQNAPPGGWASRLAL